MANLVDEQKDIVEQQTSSTQSAVPQQDEFLGLSMQDLNARRPQDLNVRRPKEPLVVLDFSNRESPRVRMVDFESQSEMLSRFPLISDLCVAQVSNPPARFKVANDLLADTWVHGHLPKQQINDIRTLAEEALGDPATALSWLCEPNMATDDRPPIQLLGTPEGFDRVKNLLLRIQYGVLA